MQSDRDQSAKKAIHQTLYNIDSVLNSISSLDDEEAELELSLIHISEPTRPY